MTRASFTAAEKLKDIQRELEWRRFVYPGRVSEGKMSAHESAWQIQIFEAIALDYALAAKQERLL